MCLSISLLVTLFLRICFLYFDIFLCILIYFMKVFKSILIVPTVALYNSCHSQLDADTLAKVGFFTCASSHLSKVIG